jgi:acyl-coenzyme A thioesterase PaaI-like protein
MSAETLGGAGSSSGAGDPAAATSAGPSASAEGFFRADGDALVPAAFATSPWGQVLHGRLIGGLTARAAEQARAEFPGMTCSRLTIDMFRSVPLAPVRVTTRPVRAGRRIAVLDLTVEQDGVPVGQGRAVLLRQSAQPDGPFHPAPVWDAPKPPQLGPPRSASTSRWTAPWESWSVGGTAGPVSSGLWIRDIHPLVTGEPLTPVLRAAMAADLASPVSNYSTRGLSFINADYTLYLGREPLGEYVGIQPAWHISEAGVAAGHCVLHDLRGPVGFVTTAAIANPTMG